jgi:hypothetical protein
MFRITWFLPSLFFFGVCSAAVDFQAQGQVPLAGAGAGDRIVVGQFNGDQYPDLLVSPARGEQAIFQDGLNVVIADGQGGFLEGDAFEVGVQITGLAVADFNGDGKLDLAATEGVRSKGAAYPPCGSLKGGVPVFLGGGDGSFGFQTCLAAGDVPAAVVAGDFNEDGKIDLIVGNASTSNSGTTQPIAYFFAGNGDGTFQAGIVVLEVYGDDAAVADFNRDGHLDLVLGPFVFQGKGDGTFVKTAGGLVGRVSRLAVGDVNGDGWPDLAAVGSLRQNSSDDVVSYAINDGNGTVGYAGTLPAGSHPVGIAIADLNGDGLGDVITANNLSDTITVILASSAGEFQAPLTLPAGLDPTAVAAGDFNGDGRLDLAVANHNEGQDGTLTILIQKATDPALTRTWFPFYEADAANFTGFAVSNDSTGMTQVSFLGLAPDGRNLPYPRNPRSFALPAHGQLAFLGNEIFEAAQGSVQKGWVEVTSDRFLGSLFMFGSGRQLDGSIGFTGQSKVLHFTRVHEGAAAFRGQSAETLVSIANPNPHPITLRLNLIGVTADQPLAAAKVRTLPARGYFCESVSQIFGQQLEVETGRLTAEVTTGEGAVGFELVRLKDRDTVFGLNAWFSNDTADPLYSAQFAAVPGFFTEIKVVNTSAVARDLTLVLLNDQGMPLTASATLALPAGGSSQLDAATLFSLAANSDWIGTLRIEASGPGVVADVLFGDAVAFDRAAALPLQNRRFLRAVFSQVANTIDFYTGLALHNPGTATAAVTIQVYSRGGSKTGETLIQLKGGERLSQLLTELMPATAGQSGGYVVINATEPLIAQQLFGGLQVLSAVPAMVIQ